MRPFYVTSDQTKVPGLAKVIVYFEGDVAIADTLQEALTSVFGESPNTREEGFGGTEATGGAVTGEEEVDTSGTVMEQVSRLLVEANDLSDQADQALEQRDLAKYQELNQQARAKTQEAERLLEADLAAQGATTTTSTTVPSA